MNAQHRRFRALRHAAWQTTLRVRGYRYRLAQIRRIVLATLEHLELPADARVMEVQPKDGGKGLVVVIAWDQVLPTLETVALSRYVISKISAITGLTYAHTELFFEPYLPPSAQLSEEHTSSHWLRERIRRIATSQRPHRRSDAAASVPTLDHPVQQRVFAPQTAPLEPDATAALISDLRERLRASRGRASRPAPLGDEPSTQMLPGRDAIFDGYLTVNAELVDLPPIPRRKP